MHGARRKLSEPKIAGQRLDASLCSQLTTSEGDSSLLDLIVRVCDDSHVRVKRKKLQKNGLEMPGLATYLGFRDRN